jgi:hypothetical protein
VAELITTLALAWAIAVVLVVVLLITSSRLQVLNFKEIMAEVTPTVLVAVEVLVHLAILNLVLATVATVELVV